MERTRRRRRPAATSFRMLDAHLRLRRPDMRASRTVGFFPSRGTSSEARTSPITPPKACLVVRFFSKYLYAFHRVQGRHPCRYVMTVSQLVLHTPPKPWTPQAALYHTNGTSANQGLGSLPSSWACRCRYHSLVDLRTQVKPDASAVRKHIAACNIFCV